MTAFAHVADGNTRFAEDRSQLPKSWRLPDGRTVSGFHLLTDEEILAAGWLPVEDDRPTPGPGQHLVGPTVQVLSDKVVRRWQVENDPAPDPNVARADDAEVRLAALAEKGWVNLSAAEKGEVAQRAMEAIGFRRKARG